MKPNEHEFKVMGLAPYAKKLYANDSYEIFSSTLNISGLNFYYKEKIRSFFGTIKINLSLIDLIILHLDCKNSLRN